MRLVQPPGQPFIGCIGRKFAFGTRLFGLGCASRLQPVERIAQEIRGIGVVGCGNRDSLPDMRIAHDGFKGCRGGGITERDGLAHRIECLSAFTACRFPGEAHRPSFLICRTCGRVAETRLPALQDAVAQVADGCGFRPDPAGVEVTGICAPCDNRPGAADDSGVKASPDSGTDRPAIQSWAEPA